MKIYYVYAWHEHADEPGYYMSPLFTSRELAERFLEELLSLPEGDERAWDILYQPELIEEDVYSTLMPIDKASKYLYPL